MGLSLGGFSVLTTTFTIVSQVALVPLTIYVTCEAIFEGYVNRILDIGSIGSLGWLVSDLVVPS